MPEIRKEKLLVCDTGLFSHVAEALAPQFERTMYFSEWVRSGFPQEKHSRIGRGLPNIERVMDVFGALGDADLVVFPDVVTANLASYVKTLKPIFGTSKHAAELELDRWGTRKVIKGLGLPVSSATHIVGTQDLQKYLKKARDVFVKYGRFRGDLETFHHERWFTTEEWFKDTERHLGPSGPEAEFVVEEPIDGVEAAVDAYSIDGKWPGRVLWGYEEKDCGYIGRVVEFSEVPEPLRIVCQKLSPVLEERGHRGWISTECRVSDGIPYLIDPCLRCGSPPSEVQTLLIENLGDIVVEGSQGRVVDPKTKGKFAAELILKSEFAVEHFLALEIPEKIKDRIKLHNHTVIDGKDYTVPVGIPEIGAAVGVGETMDSAIKECLEAAELLKAYGLEYHVAAFEDLRTTIEEGRVNGLEWK